MADYVKVLWHERTSAAAAAVVALEQRNLCRERLQ